MPGPELLPGELPRPDPPAARPKRVVQTVAVARRVLEGEGAGALTMRRLAEEQGIQAPSLYKHFSGKAEVESALVEDALFDVGRVTHQALHQPGGQDRLVSLLTAYRCYSAAHPNLYRLATSGRLVRDGLPVGLEEWAGNPWFVVAGDPALAQALWSFAHGMVILELDGRYPPGSDLHRTWEAGAAAFGRAATSGEGRPPPAPPTEVINPRPTGERTVLSTGDRGG
jgi:AcrR family transcriptional regulator